MYDSREDTEKHIENVQAFMAKVIVELRERGRRHDASKLAPPEKDLFDEYTPKLKTLTYGSEEYKACLEQMGLALKHHYENNSHHPEHYANGIGGMDLLDVIEMLVDWKAATLRHADGNIVASLTVNRVRFGLSDQMFNVLLNTVERMGW